MVRSLQPRAPPLLFIVHEGNDVKAALANTVRVKAIRIPKEAFPDENDTQPSRPSFVPFSDQMSTVRQRALDATTIVETDETKRGSRVALHIWGIAVVLVALLVVIFR